jgi:hypothetical protein
MPQSRRPARLRVTRSAIDNENTTFQRVHTGGRPNGRRPPQNRSWIGGANDCDRAQEETRHRREGPLPKPHT